VDAGAQGLYVMLEGALRYLQGDSGPLAPAARDPEASWLAATASLHEETESYYSYCAEFLLKGDNLDSRAVLEKMLALGDSVLVAGHGSLLRVHVHTDDPEAALRSGASLGSVTTIKIDDVQAEAEEGTFIAGRLRRGLASLIGSSGRGALAGEPKPALHRHVRLNAPTTVRLREDGIRSVPICCRVVPWPS
jgi:hypothetical protein